MAWGTWIESHQEIADHPKKDALAEMLYGEQYPVDVADAATIGTLHLLWWWATSYAPDGDLSKYSDAVISRGCRWRGDPHYLIASLTQAGFIDADRRIHDWMEYAGKLIERRAVDAARKRADRANAAPKDGRRKSRRRPKDVQRTSDGAAYVPTNLTNQPTEPTEPSTPDGVDTCVSDDEFFEAFWSAFPKNRRVEKATAKRAWKARRKSKVRAEDMIAAAGHYAEYHLRAGTEPTYIKHPATFIGPDQPFKEWVDGIPAAYQMNGRRDLSAADLFAMADMAEAEDVPDSDYEVIQP